MELSFPLIIGIALIVIFVLVFFCRANTCRRSSAFSFISPISGRIWLLNRILYTYTLDSLSTGATIKNVPARKIKDIDLRVPDLAVQNKIAQIFKQNIETLKSLKVLQMQQKITANAAIQKLMAE